MSLSDLDPMPTPPTARRQSPWRIAGWSAAALLLLAPLAAMQVTDEVHWTLSDFVFAAALLLGVGLPLDIALRKPVHAAYRLGAVVALGTAFLIVWISAAVGIIGSEHDDANLLFVAVLAIGLVGSVLARFRPLGLSRAMAVTAAAQAAVAVGALVAGWTSLTAPSVESVALWVFVALWTASALLFRAAARRPRGGAAA